MPATAVGSLGDGMVVEGAGWIAARPLALYVMDLSLSLRQGCGLPGQSMRFFCVNYDKLCTSLCVRSGGTQV